MACLLKLVRLNDFAADIDELDLLSGGFGLADNGYMPVAAPYGAQYVDEPLTLKITGTSKDDLASKIHSLDEKIKQAQWWINNPSIERYQVWIRSQLDNESLPRQAMLADIRPPDKVRVYNPVEINSNYIGEYTIGITRTAYWEDPYPYPTTTTKTGINCIGGTATLSETIRGDVPARAARFTAITAGGSANVSELWAGWKTSRFGTAANFLPVWELHNGLEIDADTSETADATAYDGTRVTTSFSANATLILRQAIDLANLVSAHSINAADQRGSYQVLLRAKMSDTSVARVQMIAGLYSNSAFQAPVYRSRVPISGTAWGIYELGSIKIPFSRLPADYTLINYGVGLLAERYSGSGALHMDCLILIPTDDGAVKLTSTGSVTAGQTIEVLQAADTSLYAAAKHASNSSSIYSVVPVPQLTWGIPANDEAPILIVTTDDAAGNVKGKTIDVSYTYIPRWRVLRGNET